MYIIYYILYIYIYKYIEVRFNTERDISSLGVRTGGWVEVDVSAAVVVVVVVALGESLIDLGESLIENSESGVRMLRMRAESISD